MVVVALLVLSLFSVVVIHGEPQDNIDVYSTDSEGNERDEFFETLNIYFKIHDGAETEYRVRLYDDDESLVSQRRIVTDGDGNYFSHDEDVFLEHEGPGIYEILVEEDDGDDEASHEVLVYDEQDLTQESSVHTYDSPEREEEDEKRTFAEHETIYFTAKLRDQFGHPPEELGDPIIGDMIEVYAERDDITISVGQYLPGQLTPEGNLEDDIEAERFPEPGNYELVVRDSWTGEEFARTEFSLMYMRIEIDDEYTQGQEMEIRIESNYEVPVDIRIEDEDEELMDADNASWEDQEFKNELWVNETTIPEDAPDGTYYVRVFDSDEDIELAEEDFELEKYSLEATTDRNAYLPEDSVDLFYTAERLIDGSRAEDMDVQIRLRYTDEDDEEQEDMHYPSYDDHFQFDIPSDIEVPSGLEIDLWVNETGEEHTTHWSGDVYVGSLDYSYETDDDVYLQGEKVYVTAETYVEETDISVEDASVTVDLMQDGESVGDGQYRSTLETDDSGKVVIPIHLSEDIEPGYYHVNVSAEKHETMLYPEEYEMLEIQVIDEIKRLDVSLDRDQHSYSPGEEVVVEYTVTDQGEEVDANVKYDVIKGDVRQVYEKGYAEDGEIVFNIPEGFNQDEDLYLRVEAKQDQETTGQSYMRIPVLEMDLLLNADQHEYSGGETIDFEYEVIGREEDFSAIYKIFDHHGDIVEMDEPEDGEFYYEVPEVPSSEYEVRLEVSSEGLMVEESIELHRADRYQLEIGIETSSSYTTGVYEPGDEIDIRYKVRAVGREEIPEKMTLRYFIPATGEEGRVQTSSPEGTFTIEVPEVSDGTYHLQVMTDIGDQEPGLQNAEPIDVEEDPSIWSYRIFGSLSLLGLIGIILLLILLAAGFYNVSGKEKPRSVLSELFRKREKEPEEEEEERSPAEEAHGWAGPDEVDYEDEDQIEPERPE